MIDIIMTIREVAQVLKLAEKTVYSMAVEGELPAFKVRGQWRIRRIDFESWLSCQATGIPGKSIAVSTGDQKKESTMEASVTAANVVSVGELTERVPQDVMHRLFASTLGEHVRSHGDLGSKPFELHLKAPLPQKVRVYMYNATRPPGGRPLGEHKIQLIVPGQRRGVRGSFDNTDGYIVLLVGYAAEENIFILWDAGLYSDFAWSRNVQVRAETIIEATAGKIATQLRQLRPPTGRAIVETVIAVKPRRLSEAILMRNQLTLERMIRE
jgi:excisionase family DNA binding protein